MSAPVPRPPKLSVTVRRSRFTDLPALVYLYRHRSEESKRTYHPFPFSRVRLSAIYLWMIVVQRWMRPFVRHFPKQAAVLLIAERAESPRMVGYGTVRLMSGYGEEPVARFGYLVRDDCQGRGVGGQIVMAQVMTAKAAGIKKGGGTVLKSNVASSHLIEKWGWRFRRGGQDRGAPQEENLETVGDLDEILRGRGM
ncbi:MAG TPA: GNAT family N-acetyltransferase [Thermoplasmata archaeon]|nr:GNAT family N-acetyltransferase [Thermoplasmata archaeon]